MSAELQYERWLQRSRRAERSAHRILAKVEDARSRVILLGQLPKKLAGSPVDVQDYFSEAIQCLEAELYRAAVVTAWAGHFHLLVETLYARFEAELRAIRPKWKFADLADLKESYPEAQILDAAKAVKLVRRADLKVLHGQLSQRNRCAHPTVYRPSLNAAVGYVDEMIAQTLSYAMA